FWKYGRVESVKVLPKRGSEGGVAAFVDFVDIKSAQKAHNSINKMGDRDLRTDYNEPGTIPSAARGLDDSLSIATRGRDVSGFTRGAGGPVYGPPVSLHSREGRFERRLDGAADGRERSYDHSAYGHHERSSSNSSSFDRQRHYETDYYRDSRDRALRASVETRYEFRAREAFTLASVVHRDLYKERGRRGERTYHHSRSRSPHSSQSHNPSPQRLPSQAVRLACSRSGSGSRSRSSSSDSVSSTSSSGSASVSELSRLSPARSVQSAAVPAPPAQPLPSLDKDEPRKSFGIKVQNLPVRSTDTSLKDGLFHEFKKHGKVTSVQIHGASEERYGLVFFRQQEDQEKALSASKGKLFFGMQIDVTAWHGPETESENEFRPLDERIDEFHPKATRTLFIGNLEKTTTYHDLLNIFQRFGEIVDIDIKKVNGSPQYAFLQYCDIASVCKAIKKMDGEYLGNNRLKLGFGKSMPTTCVWLDGLSSSITEQYLTRHFCRYGHVVKVVFDRLKGMALILYNNIEYAQAAVKETKGWKIGGNKIKVDFANQESQMAFYRSMQASGQDIRDFYEIINERRDERRPPYHEFTAERAYYENVHSPGSYTEDPRRKYPARSREFYSEWDPYQGDYYDPQYYDDPREYRDYRDPYEQDIRKYSYLQRERERERERFETDRERDHGRRTIEHNQSPSHPRRPASPAASPSLSEHPPSDSEHHVYSRSSERSGSCSSLSPPRLEKPDKICLERHNRSDKSEKDKSIFEAERGNGGEKDRHAGRKEKGDKDRTEKQKLRKLKLASPTVPSSEPGKLDLPPCVVQLTREKGLASQVEVVDKDGKVKNKKYFKTDFAFDTSSSVDADRLAARKRRFEETSGKADNLRKISQEEDEVKLRRIIDESLLKDIDYDKKMQQKEAYKREKMKLERMITVSTTKEELDTVMSVGLSLDLQARLGEPTEEQHLTSYHILSSRLERDSESKESLLSDIDHSQSCRKQMEQNRLLHQQLLEYDKSDKTESTPSTDAEDFEHRSLVHEIGKPPQDVTGDSPPSKRKKSGPFEFDFGTKRQRDYQRFRQINDEPERRLASLPGTPFAEDASQLLEKEPDSPVEMNKNCLHFDVSKYNIGNAVRQGLSSHAEILKVKTSVTEEEFCWESNIRQSTLRGEMSFPTSIVKRESIRKRPERELEPGEVQTDSDEDSESRHLSLKPNFFKREHEERLSVVKSSESLEKNKFYEFALDKTITPDTKALLERAKSLSSSREENWSFLGHDSQFKSFRNSTDKEKSEPTPRPIPSWYMKKKKIRSDSDGKLDGKKKDAKPDEQERQELFASRFLHSSIFEQDSRRLQHLEWKNNDPEVRVGRDSITSDSQGEQVGTGGSDLSQEPRVLFHSRFLELQQRDKNQQLPVSERFSLTEEEEEEEEEKTLDEEFGPSPNVSEISQELTVSHIPATASPMSRSKVSETSQSEDAPVDSLPSISLKEENTAVTVSAMPTEPMIKEDVTVKELNEKLSESIRAVNPPVELDIDVKPLTPAASPSNIEPECDPFQASSATFSKPSQPQEIAELSETKTEPVYASLHKVASPLDVELPETEPEVEQVQPLHKQPKSKKVKTVSPTPIPQVANEKPATRKSERIDKEKLKRSSSPRGDSTKLIADPKNSAKSPVHATDSDQGLESNTSHGKTRQRRNVRSVYATPHEDEASQQPGKEITEPPRSTRKRCSDKEAATQHMVTTPGKRGRPPKTRKRGDDMSPVKGDQTKNSESEDTESKESTSSGEISKTAETWRSPRSQKGQSSPIRAGQIRKTLKLDKVSSSPEPIQPDTAAVDVSPALDHQNESKDETSILEGSLKTKTTQIVNEDSNIPIYHKEEDVHSPEEKEETLSEMEPPTDPVAALLARQMELERAVENISRLTDEQHPAPYKEPRAEPATLTSPVIVQRADDAEVEKPANPASETELAAAIDSITAEDISGDSPLSEAAKKGGRARPKTPKKSRGRKVSLNRKLDLTDDAVLEPESTIVKLPESIPEEIQTANPKAATSAAAAAVVTVAPEPQESAFHSGNNSPSYLRTKQPSPELVAPAFTSPTTCLNSPASSKAPLTPPEWNTRTEEKGIPPKPQVSVALSTPGVEGPPANPPMPPDTKASDIDPSSSTLRKILMEPKYVSASNSNAVPSMQFTTTLADPRMSDNKNSVEAVLPLKTSLPEDRPSPVTQFVPRTAPTQPPTLQQCESPQILKEKLAITSTATSVISRIPMPFDFEDTPRISLSNRSPGMSLLKQKYRTGLNENSRYQGLNPSDDAGSVGRPVVGSTHCNTGSSTGLRVNTSEGVVVLSYSGQKTEGPQRIIAKISQIPPASAMDIEFQQSVTKSQIKQEPPSHPSTPKGSQTPTGYGHAGVILAGQTFSAQSVISSINQESLSSEKSEPSYHTALQAGSVKTFQQSTSHPQLLRYGQSITQQQHIKKNGATETVSMKAGIKPSSFFNVKPVLSPHHPSLAGNHILSPSTAHERVVSQPKQDSHSSRASGHSTSPFPKVCPPTSSVVLGPAGPISQYVSNKHHAEQSVIMPPHSVTQSVPIGHLSQGDVRASTPSLSGIGYGIRSENLLSPRSAPPQRSMTPQPAVIRDVVLKSHASSSVDGQVVGTSNDDLQSLPQGLRRASAPQLQPESIVMQPEFKGLHHRALCLDQYARDVHLLVHQHLTDHPGVVESRQTRTPEAMQSPSHISSTSSKVSPVVKNAPQTVRDAPKAMELKMPPSPHSDNRIIGHPPGSVMVSPQGVQLIHSGNANSMSEYYREMRGFHPQYPMTITPKLELPISVQKGPNQMPPPSSASSQMRSDFKLDHTGLRSVDMVQLLTKYPIIWQGHLALKNDTAAVQLHFVSGNNVLAHRSLPPPEGGAFLRIAQRMRLEASQLEGVARRMTAENEYCLLLALPCGLDQEDVHNQTHALKTGFITYLQAKQAAGIINVPNPGSNQPAYVVQIFPPCEFSESHLSHLAPDLLNSISNISPHLMIVIASV
uniref:Msx2-interacting protein n=1 Tax=Sinocyclocheilus rhinocerous TaxID=307959 RepID=A0A673L4J5_9TELE